MSRSRFLHFIFIDTATTGIYTLSLHDALPIWYRSSSGLILASDLASSWARSSGERSIRSADPPLYTNWASGARSRSEEHTSELQSRRDLVCRLLLEKKKYGGMRNEQLRQLQDL